MVRDPEPVLSYDPEHCPFTATWQVIGGKWKGLIWWRLSRGLSRFGQLRRSLPQVSKKMLVQQLRELERDGIVRREQFDQIPARVEYSLTADGRSLEPVILAISSWGHDHLKKRQETVAAERR